MIPLPNLNLNLASHASSGPINTGDYNFNSKGKIDLNSALIVVSVLAACFVAYRFYKKG
jgi:hypothetical protein